MEKMISMPLTEYNKEVEDARTLGRQEGVNFLIQAVKDIFENEGKNLQVSEDATGPTVDFINYIKEKANTETTEGETE